MRRRADQQGFSVAVGAASPYDRDIVGGVLLDLSRSLRADERTRAAGERAQALLTDAQRLEAGDPRRRRRLLALGLADALCDATQGGPVLLVVEDLHWVDDLSLEVLERVARRAASLPLLLCGSYRTDEPRSRLREWRARLLGQRLAEEAVLRRLTEIETRTVLLAILGAASSASALASALHQRSDGIPLHVEEMLAALRGRPTPFDVIELPVPETVGAAVIERAQRLSPRALGVARKATVIGRAFGLELLDAVADVSPSELDAALTELDEGQFVLRDREGAFQFRHGLICDAIYDAIPRLERLAVHLRVAEAAAARADRGDASYIAAQFDRAGDSARAYVWALAAARQAAAISAHRVASAAYRVAVRNLAADVPAADRARVLAEHAGEAAAIDDNETAAGAYAEARALLLGSGERLLAAELVPPLAAARHLLGADLQERRSLLTGALADIVTEADPVALRVRARLEAGLAAAYMLDRQLALSEAAGHEAIRDARAAGDSATEIDTLVTVGSVKVMAGDMEAGWAMLAEGLTAAAANGLEAAAARAYRMIGSGASMLVEYERAERWLREGIAYAERTDLWNHRHYMAAHLAHVLWATGRWGEAADLIEQVIADGRGGITTHITALHVNGFLNLARGDPDRARGELEQARMLGERMAELQRLSPALWGLAELAVLAGDPVRALELVKAGRTASERVGDAAYLFPFAVTGTRAYLAAGDPTGAAEWARSVAEPIGRRAIPGTLPALDHAAALVLAAEGSTARARGLLVGARAAWVARGRVWEGTWALLDLARCELRSGRVDDALGAATDARSEAERLGAAPLVTLADEILRLARERGGLAEPWAPLTAREFDVARSIGAGLTNAQVAAELRISPRTVATHVEHILAKLGASRRSEIAVWAATRTRMRQ